MLRKIISDTVKNDTETYSEAFLGQSNIEYSKWIFLKDSWGGAIELSILSNYYATEIATFDIQTENMYVYGETKNYKQRIFLLYDGIHYDCLCLTPIEGAPEEIDITIFSVNDQNIVNQAKQLTKKLGHAKHRNRRCDERQTNLRMTSGGKRERCIASRTRDYPTLLPSVGCQLVLPHDTQPCRTNQGTNLRRWVEVDPNRHSAGFGGARKYVQATKRR